ncbi:glycoside hydrolase family 9 protein [Natronobiforma cellulositropha]|uniref:glycoside hydrolase family 9 protein n=1 Tax=Natronobiforma cellulositropha TaxID=1679076 RepID=UPI0021D5DA58|nr:glycoside hydrolase family 9 protein [Natronobiforma cellulositropha]
MARIVTTGRRDVLKATGGLAALAALGTLPGTAAAEYIVDETPVRVNQLGYLPDESKMAVVLADTSTFEVQDAATGTTVYEGDLSAPVDDEPSGQTVRHADFSALTDDGEYVIAVDGATSHPFEIGEDVFDDALAEMGRLFTLKRAATHVADPITGIDIGPGHTQDAQAQMAAPDDEYYSQGETLDVSGGWYDAGDYGKYVTPSAITVGCLLLAYERNPGAFTEGQFEIPDSIDDPYVGTMPDVLVECRTKLEWFQKMQRPDGGLYYIVSGQNWPGMNVRPEQDTQQRYVFGLSSAGTAMAGATFAQAARLYEDHDPDFAAEMLACAEDAFAFIEDNPSVVWRTDPGQDDGSGPYTRSGNDDNDRFWLAAELLKTTGDSRYNDYLESAVSAEFGEEPNSYDWTSGFTIGQWAYLTADAADESRKSQIEGAILEWADDLLEHIDEDGYNNALEAYYWGCVKNGVGRGHILLLANEIQPNQAYVDAALDQLHHAFGRSATGYSYVTELGDLTPENPHDRIVESTGTVLPGMVVGGPNNEPANDGSTNYFDPSTTPPALSYVDVTDSYSTNEWAINYSAPVVLMVAEVVNWEGRKSDDGDDGPEPSGLDVNGDGNDAQDLTGDGLYEDVTGDGNLGFNDVVTFFEEHNNDVVQSNASNFDFSGNGSVGFNDVVALFERL